MTGLNVSWALAQLDEFIRMTTMRTNGTWVETVAGSEDVAKRWEVVERVVDRVTPNWRTKIPTASAYDSEWLPMRTAALRAREALAREDEIRQNLGDNAPMLSASGLHPWVWNGAASLWQSGHYRSAVEDAAKKVNAETQNKVGRRDLGETKLFQEVYSEKPAEPSKPRLRRMAPDASDTYRSVQRGAMALAEGIYAGIRNPFNHESPADIDEQVALEYLAALSVLARWVDESTVERAP